MKPFDLEKAKAGEPIVCRDGTPAKFIAHVPEAGDRNFVVLADGDICTAFQSGRMWASSESTQDLFMADKPKVKRWIPYHAVESGFTTEEYAKIVAKRDFGVYGRVAEVEVEDE